MAKSTNKIICPTCGKEYLPAEIFMADGLLGHPEDIVRDEDGKIIFNDGTKPELTEEFECDCGCSFLIEATLQFKTTEQTNKNKFEEEYVVKL